MKNTKNVNHILSDNSIASDNFSQNTLVSFEGLFNGLDKLIALFFPSVRNAVVERYRAETTLIIAQKAEKLKNIHNIKTNQIPPKAAIPLFEKLSLEHEENMYDLWAKLLLDTSASYKPKHIQYAEILSKIGGQEARLLKAVFDFQKPNKYLIKDIEDEFNDYANKCLIADTADEISSNLEIGDVFEDEGQYHMIRSNIVPEIHIDVPYPENITLYNRTYIYNPEMCDEEGLELLKQLNLVKIFYDSGDTCIVLTILGYDLLNTLNKY